jgi:hypothetical protein
MVDTIGSLVDKLCTVDLKMWNNQELLYEIRRMTYDQFKQVYLFGEEGRKKLWDFFQKVCDLNLQRNALIDEIDEKLIALTGRPDLDDGKHIQRKHKTF